MGVEPRPLSSTVLPSLSWPLLWSPRSACFPWSARPERRPDPGDSGHPTQWQLLSTPWSVARSRPSAQARPRDSQTHPDLPWKPGAFTFLHPLIPFSFGLSTGESLGDFSHAPPPPFPTGTGDRGVMWTHIFPDPHHRSPHTTAVHTPPTRAAVQRPVLLAHPVGSGPGYFKNHKQERMGAGWGRGRGRGGRCVGDTGRFRSL